jgi:hypothetical protein
MVLPDKDGRVHLKHMRSGELEPVWQPVLETVFCFQNRKSCFKTKGVCLATFFKKNRMKTCFKETGLTCFLKTNLCYSTKNMRGTGLNLFWF